jgi:hypothetical protein
MSAFVLNVGGFGFGVLIRTCPPPFIAGVDFDEESFGRVFVPKKQAGSVTELKAFLGCTQQMSRYCCYYGIVASPLHRLTRVTEAFPKQ